MFDQPKVIEPDKTKRFLVTFGDDPVCSCDTAGEVGNFLRRYPTWFGHMRVFDKGVEMFSKMYLDD